MNDRLHEVRLNSALQSTKYDENYYHEHKNVGLDFLTHGYWQHSYASMVMECTKQYSFDSPGVVDIGAACGSVLKSFKNHKLSPNIIGFDVSEYMVGIGRSEFGLSEKELVISSVIPEISFQPTLIHAAQVFEHINMTKAYRMIEESSHMLHPNGYMFICLDAIRPGKKYAEFMSDPTHVNIVETEEWENVFYDCGLVSSWQSNFIFRHSKLGPTENEEDNFHKIYSQSDLWTLYILKKAKKKKDTRLTDIKILNQSRYTGE